ncbi:hypothetical protein BDN70DRAFT_592170 [Pholiota conissans]|uniref:Uncharacterized protein n=1 Tax=Pholiota conissans TaxID=109636 RepID=A0A9P5ZCI1_9AGAR|nr:hypothetical protein BDN70DRAFT_592170 [Pholiota conissans]
MRPSRRHFAVCLAPGPGTRLCSFMCMLPLPRVKIRRNALASVYNHSLFTTCTQAAHANAYPSQSTNYGDLLKTTNKRWLYNNDIRRAS